jgi:molybdopterin/thiamine biosynthesis adenylyltransferase
MKRADQTHQVFYFIHSHPNGICEFSAQDDAEESKLMRTAYIRIAGAGPHGTIVFADRDRMRARCWKEDGSATDFECIRIIGRQLRFLHTRLKVPAEVMFDRQVRAFGGGIQATLAAMHVGIVGCGGTGSAVAEQLARLGIGSLTLFDPDRLEQSNISRVYGSSLGDLGKPKAQTLRDSLFGIGFPLSIRATDSPITRQSAARQLRDCDVIFGCTDDEWGRAVLTRFALYYYVPVFDLGVRIDSDSGNIKSIQGRVTTLLPGASCLFCRGRISGERIAAQAVRENDPHRAATLRNEGYMPEMPQAEPAVVSFNTFVASLAVIELIQRLTGFMGDNRETTEMICLFDEGKIRPNARPADAECFCSDPVYQGRGDVDPFIDLTWAQE